MGGRITLEFHSDNGTDNTVLAAGFSDLSTLPSDYTAGELPGWRSVMCPKVFARPESLVFAYRMADIESVSETAIMGEDNYSALYSAAPADVGYFDVILQCVSGGTTSAYVLITMELDVQFEEPILVAQS